MTLSSSSPPINPGTFKYTVVEKKRRKGKQKPFSPPTTFENLLDQSRRDLQSTPCWPDIKVMVSKLDRDKSCSTKILCLGLGSPMISDIARKQLILLQELQLHFGISDSNVSIYDPAFTPEDIEGLEAMGFSVDMENKQGKHELHVPTLVFMPHCERFVIEGLLSRNWSPEKLRLLTLVGNDLEFYSVHFSTSELAATNPCVARIVPWLKVTKFPPSTASTDVFNCLAMQTIHIDDATTPTSEDESILTTGCGRKIARETVHPSDPAFWEIPQESSLPSIDVDN
ncbi:hypothetical protein FRB97_004635 [Tulasnella sp. 331]|nr:hypothetical protein FRB97_004635 [Tulasnella sp. 331]KAG8865926.1 hypothetical protein FRB98_005175 [Tulasnella sp. 332]